MAGRPGANQTAVTHFPTSTQKVYFDYTVVTPSGSDTGEVEVFAGSPSGALVASSSLIFAVSSSFDAVLQPAKGPWPEGSYCSVLLIDGQRATAGGRMPIGWSVGTAPVPTCNKTSEPALNIRTMGTLQSGHKGTLRVLVQSSSKAVAGVSVSLDGSNVGMTHQHHATTGAKGYCRFAGILPRRQGHVVLIAHKQGYRVASATVSVAG
jgi:hypothetical protein